MKNIFFILTLLLFSLSNPAETQVHSSIDIENFASHISVRYNRLQQMHGIIAASPSTATIEFENAQAKITCAKSDTNFIGFFTNTHTKNTPFMNLADFDALEIIGNFPKDKLFYVTFVEYNNNKPPLLHHLALEDFFVTGNQYLISFSQLHTVGLEKISSLRILSHNNGRCVFQLSSIKLLDYNSPRNYEIESNVFPIDDFDNNINRFGNRDLTQVLPPATLITKRVPKFADNSDRCLKITAHNPGISWCMYINSFLKSDEYFDYSKYKNIMFRIKGEKGGEDPIIAFSDKIDNTRRTAWRAGSVSKYLGHPLTNQWEGVIIPLPEFGPIPETQIRELLVIFQDSKEATIYLDDIQLTKKTITFDSEKDFSFLIHGFNQGLDNTLGNKIHTFFDPPSQIKIKNTIKGSTQENPCLAVNAEKTQDNTCGLISSLKENGKYFSADSFSKLSFQIRGSEKTTLEIYLIDENSEKASHEQRQIRLKKATITNISGQWQTVELDLLDFDINLKKLSAIVFTITSSGKQTFYIDNIAFE